MKLNTIATKYIDELSATYEKEEAEAIFQVVLNHVLNFSRADYVLKKENTIDAATNQRFEEVLQALKTGKPIQYILGEAYFFGLTFKVNESVLIPRPETEELVDWILSASSNQHLSKEINVLDIGTGSGCIAIALQKNMPNAAVFGLDIAEDTLQTASQNALINQADVLFTKDDIIQSQNKKHDRKYSVIVSNPPYIKEDEMPQMHQNVLAHEPHLALFVSNENPLLFYEAICNFALLNLKENGLLFFEINEYLGKQTVDLLNSKGFVNIELRQDMQGKDRMIKANLS